MLFLNYFVKNYIQSGDWYYPPGGGPRKRIHCCGDCGYRADRSDLVKHARRMHPSSTSTLPPTMVMLKKNQFHPPMYRMRIRNQHKTGLWSPPSVPQWEISSSMSLVLFLVGYYQPFNNSHELFPYQTGQENFCWWKTGIWKSILILFDTFIFIYRPLKKMSIFLDLYFSR